MDALCNNHDCSSFSFEGRLWNFESHRPGMKKVLCDVKAKISKGRCPSQQSWISTDTWGNCEKNLKKATETWRGALEGRNKGGEWGESQESAAEGRLGSKSVGFRRTRSQEFPASFSRFVLKLPSGQDWHRLQTWAQKRVTKPRAPSELARKTA